MVGSQSRRRSKDDFCPKVKLFHIFMLVTERCFCSPKKSSHIFQMILPLRGPIHNEKKTGFFGACAKDTGQEEETSKECQTTTLTHDTPTPTKTHPLRHTAQPHSNDYCSVLVTIVDNFTWISKLDIGRPSFRVLLRAWLLRSVLWVSVVQLG